MTENYSDVDDVIWGGGGARTAVWAHVGAWVGGVIQSRPRRYHAREFIKGQASGGKPKYFPSGDPVLGVKVDVQTNMRDPADPEDDGIRRFYLEKARQLDALRNALREVDCRVLEPGGESWVQWTGEEADTQSDANPAKTWLVKYRPPTQAIPGEWPTQQQSAQQSAQQNAQPAYGTPVAPAPVPMPQPAPVAQPVAPQPVYAPVPAPMPAQVPAPAYAPPAPVAVQQAPPGYAPVPAPPPAQPAAVQPAPAPNGSAPQNVITASVEASLRAQGINTSGFTVVPG